ncbi:hypothetical protein NliqN6_3760 [Naganishia liquefaciens]|uniref:Delta 8-(E)-sphingolipid desaturase n=1 Tax=Naganishia liquefaciens TaxID=104408 RepID=A0A8H3TUI7_9TREE|nr:hypothetical protein NliqN6_3760 [Naganishia liquefaciens]
MPDSSGSNRLAQVEQARLRKTPLPSRDRTAPISRTTLKQRIVAGEYLVIYQDQVLNLTRWADTHPGGKLAILHFVGRDATDEMNAYHSARDIKRFAGFVCGQIESRPHRPLTPPIALGLVRDHNSLTGWRREGSVELANKFEQQPDADKQDLPSQSARLLPEMLELGPEHDLDLSLEASHSRAYRDLKSRIESAGLFTAPGTFMGYGADIARYCLLGGLAAWLYFASSSMLGWFASAVALGAFWHQLTFVAHDAGHTGITGDNVTDRILGTVVADWVGGLSLSWWKDNHNIHHLVTNHPEHDPDIQHIPFFAISTRFFSGLWSTYYKRVMAFDAFSRAMIGLQHKIYYFVLSLARFNLYANSYGFLALKMPRNRWFAFEVAGLAFFWTWFGMLLKGLPNAKTRVMYLLVSHIVTSPVHVQIVLSHFARSTDDLGPIESFPSRQLRTTMDVICSPWIEFFHGGLHLQVTHHLFPRIPRHNLRKASLFVKQFCKEQELEYAEYSFTEGNQRVLRVLRDVSNQLSLLRKVAAADARGELH